MLLLVALLGFPRFSLENELTAAEDKKAAREKICPTGTDENNPEILFLAAHVNKRTSPVGTTESSPKILLVIFDAMFFQNGQILLLKILLPMMFFLLHDIVYCPIDM